VSNLRRAVRAGDHLGFSISGSDFAPYCHLEYDTKRYPGDSKGQTPRLFAQGAGQNSWRGIDGKTSVVYEREGRGIKFSAKVEWLNWDKATDNELQNALNPIGTAW
jgi:hypothetical protein